MGRLLPFVCVSVTVHGALLAVLLPASSHHVAAQVFEISALISQRPDAPLPAPSPPRAEPEPEPQKRQPSRPRRVVTPKVPADPETEQPQQLQDLSEPDVPSSKANASVGVAPLPGPSLPAGKSIDARVGGGSQRGSPGNKARAKKVGRGRPLDPCQDSVAALRKQARSKAYPAWARELGLSGRIKLALRVSRGGQPKGVRVVTTSGHSGLDRHAQKVVRSLKNIPYCPRQIHFPLVFRPR